jgi:hypothetical protein
VYLLCNLGTSVLALPPISLMRTLQVLVWGRQKKQVERLFFCIGIIKFDLALHMMSFPYCIFFNKKKIGENFAGFLSLGILDIVCVFT